MNQNEMRKPSYIDYMNSFWMTDENESLTSVQSRLYFLLLNIFNSRKWVDEVALSDHYLCDLMGVSLNTLRPAKRVLQSRGLIEFSAGGRGFANKTKYTLRCQLRVQCRGQSAYQSRLPNSDNILYKENIDIKTKDKIKNKGFGNGGNTTARRGANYTESDFD